MSFFYENALAVVAPGTYLAVYSIGFAVVAALGRARRGRIDETVGMRLHVPQDDLDPHELAYLSGGNEELARLILFDLVRRGWLTFEEESSVFSSDSYVRRADDHPPEKLLRPIELEVWRHIEGTVLMSSLMGTINLPDHLSSYGEDFHKRLEKRRLVMSSEREQHETALILGAMCFVMMPGAYRMLVSMHAHSEEWFICLVWTFLSAITVWLAAAPRSRTELGDRYLNALREEFDAMRDNVPLWGEAAAAHTATLAALYGSRVVMTGPAAAEIEYARQRAPDTL